MLSCKFLNPPVSPGTLVSGTYNLIPALVSCTDCRIFWQDEQKPTLYRISSASTYRPGFSRLLDIVVVFSPKDEHGWKLVREFTVFIALAIVVLPYLR